MGEGEGKPRVKRGSAGGDARAPGNQARIASDKSPLLLVEEG